MFGFGEFIVGLHVVTEVFVVNYMQVGELNRGYCILFHCIYFKVTCRQAAHEICGEPSTEYSSGQLPMGRGQGNIAKGSYAVASSGVGDRHIR